MLEKRTKEEQKFFGDVRSYFADLAKTSFGIGMELTGHGDAWTLPIAQPNIAINKTLWRMLRKEKPLQQRKLAEVTDIAATAAIVLKRDATVQRSRQRIESTSKADRIPKGRWRASSW